MVDLSQYIQTLHGETRISPLTHFQGKIEEEFRITVSIKETIKKEIVCGGREGSVGAESETEQSWGLEGVLPGKKDQARLYIYICCCQGPSFS